MNKIKWLVTIVVIGFVYFLFHLSIVGYPQTPFYYNLLAALFFLVVLFVIWREEFFGLSTIRKVVMVLILVLLLVLSIFIYAIFYYRDFIFFDYKAICSVKDLESCEKSSFCTIETMEFAYSMGGGNYAMPAFTSKKVCVPRFEISSSGRFRSR